MRQKVKTSHTVLQSYESSYSSTSAQKFLRLDHGNIAKKLTNLITRIVTSKLGAKIQTFGILKFEILFQRNAGYLG